MENANLLNMTSAMKPTVSETVVTISEKGIAVSGESKLTAGKIIVEETGKLAVSAKNTPIPDMAVVISDEDVVISDERKFAAGEFIRSKRKEKNLSQRDLAAKVGISYSVLSRIESGQAFPSALTLRRMAPYLSVPYDELLFSVGYSFNAKGDNPIYLDLNGKVVDISEKAMKLYQQNVELFFLTDKWLDSCSAEDEGLINKLLLLLLRETDCRKKKKNELTAQDNEIMNFTQGIRHLIQSCDFLLDDRESQNNN